jgi:acetylornithine deacetylase/succinyl-diaminopimelate desuccinylase-like protein
MQDTATKWTVELLSRLIQINTTNPPGNETPAAKLIAEEIEGKGLEYKLLESAPGRGNIVAWAESRQPGPTVLLLSHLDVVPANPEEWTVDPFSGLVKDGYVWGRGAIDNKLSAAVLLRVFLDLAETGKFKGRLIYAATADEEMGGRMGAGWLVEKHPELVRADYLINEGGGFEIPGKHSAFTVQTAEKGVYWFKLTFKGKPGHASIPRTGENALLYAAEAATRIAENSPPIEPTPHVKLFVQKLLESRGTPRPLAKLLSSRPLVSLLPGVSGDSGPMLDAMLRNTLTPTVIASGEKVNIIPSTSQLSVDCRLLPGHAEKWVEAYLKETLKGLDYRLEFIHRDPASQSPIGTPLYKAIEKTVSAIVPGAQAAPYMSTGGTDSRFFRVAFNTVAYGFIPIRADLPLSQLLKMIHGIDERISINNIQFSQTMLKQTLETFYTIV